MSSTRITNLLIIIVSCLIAFAGLELIIRQLDVMKTKMGITKGYSQLYSDERTTADYVFGHHPNVSVVLSNENMEIKFTTNSEGLRERKNYNLLDNSIIFLGDSVIEGMVDDGETIDEHFEALSNITSLNYGLGSSNTIHEYLYLKGKYKDQYNTSIVILGICVNDIKQNNFLRAFNKEIGNWELYKYVEKPKQVSKENKTPFNLRSLLEYSRVVMFTYSSVKGLFVDTQNYSKAHLSKNFSNEEIQNTIGYVKKMKDFLDSKNIELYVTIFPTRDQIESNNLHLGIQGKLENLLIKQNINVINIDKNLILISKEEGLDKIWLDNIHLKSNGNKVVANSIYTHLKENKDKL